MLSDLSKLLKEISKYTDDFRLETYTDEHGIYLQLWFIQDGKKWYYYQYFSYIEISTGFKFDIYDLIKDRFIAAIKDAGLQNKPDKGFNCICRMKNGFQKTIKMDELNRSIIIPINYCVYVEDIFMPTREYNIEFRLVGRIKGNNYLYKE